MTVLPACAKRLATIPAECQNCGDHIRPYDTEPWQDEITFAYECRCGHIWTIDAYDLKDKR